MDLDDFKKRLQTASEEVKKRLPEIATVLALSAKALAERRIKDKGFSEVYSQNQVPAWFLHGKELNQKGVKFLENHGVGADGKQGEGKKKRRKKKGDPDPGSYDKTTNWGEFRAAQGLQNSFVDLSYSNKMWANMAPVSVEERGHVVRALLGATNTEAQNKMNWNRERYGDFIQKGLVEEDRETLTAVVANELIKVLDQFKF